MLKSAAGPAGVTFTPRLPSGAKPEDRLEAGRRLRESPEGSVAALIAIGVFLAAILLLNLVEFGRPD